MHGFMEDDLTGLLPCSVNRTNNNDVFALHAVDGIQILVTDGGGRFVTSSVPIDVTDHFSSA